MLAAVAVAAVALAMAGKADESAGQEAGVAEALEVRTADYTQLQ